MNAESPVSAGPRIFEGYTRGRFFDRRFLEFTVLVLMVLACALYLFPRHKVLVQFYLDRGLFNEAIAVISDMIAQRPDDFELMLLRADALQRADDPDSAMDQLQLVLDRDPLNRQALVQMVRFHEWNRNLTAAIRTLEALSEAEPDNLAVLQRLWGYYVYLGMRDKETEAVLRLIDLEKARPLETTLPRLDDAALVAALMRDPLPRVATRQLQRLALMRRLSGSDPLRDELVRRLYSMRANYLWSWSRAPDIGIPNPAAALIGFLEAFVATTHLDAALEFAAQVDEIWPQRPRAELNLAQVLRRFHYHDQSRHLLAEVGRRFGDDRDIQLQLVDIAVAAGDLEAAAHALEELMVAAPENADFRSRLVDLYLEMNRPLSAFQRLYQTAVARGLEPGQLLRLMEIAGYTGQPDPVAKAAALVRLLVPPDPDLLQQAADMLTAVGDLEGAAKALVDYLRLRPSDAKVAAQLARLYQWTNRPDLSYAVYRQLAEQHGRAHLRPMLEAAAASGKAELARQAAAVARRLAPRDPDVLLQVGRMRMAVSDTRGAVAAYEAYLALRPADGDARAVLATLYQWDGQGPAHARLLAEDADRHPYSFEKALAAANAWMAADQLAKGIASLERAVTLKPDNAELWQRLATYYGWSNAPDKQVKALERLAAMGQLPDEQAIVLARVFLDRGEAAKAAALLEPFARDNRLPPDQILALAAAYQRMGQDIKAERIYKGLARDHAGDTGLLAELGNQALWAKRLDLALDLYEKVLRREPRNLISLKGSAQIYAWNNDAQKAIARFEAYLRLAPNDHEVRYQLGELYFANGRTGDAMDQYDRTLAIIGKTGGKAGK